MFLFGKLWQIWGHNYIFENKKACLKIDINEKKLNKRHQPGKESQITPKYEYG